MTDQTIKLPLRLSFRLTRDDIGAYERLPRELTRSGTLAFFATVFACGVALALFEEQLDGLVPEKLAGYRQIIFAIIAGAIGFTAFSLALTLLTYWRIARTELPHGDTEIDVYEDHLKISADKPAQTLGWNAVARVIDTPAHVFLCLTPRNAVIVPLRAFHSVADMRAFADLSETLSRRADSDA
ncbi:YcxB family protein [Hyphomicrobium sp. 99]|uniref:YcxB family protein n=1 Tax=Hyphomicrobium sp. 99 TaxID=1163419 RepID=UPI0005F7DC31|nr:YcxB family protein [Hyphomicrobium sp. 99]